MSITVCAFKKTNPWLEHIAKELFSGHKSLTPNDVARLDIDIDDRVRAITWCAMSDNQRCELACDCAERALQRERYAGREPDPRSWAAVEVARRYARGEATRDELNSVVAGINGVTAAMSFIGNVIDDIHAGVSNASTSSICAAWSASSCVFAAKHPHIRSYTDETCDWDAYCTDDTNNEMHVCAERNWQLARAVEIATALESVK